MTDPGASAAAPRRAFGHAEVFAVLALASLAAARFLPVLDVPYTCPARALVGLPCPTCGMTHAFVALAHGDLAGAFAASPAGALLAALAWGLALADGVRLALGAPLPAVPARAARAAVAAGVVVVLASWAWVLAREVAR
jgi:hypothetical protein